MASDVSHEVEMEIISLGQKFPIQPRGEGFIALFCGVTFDAVGFLDHLTVAEVEAFRTGDLRYGLFVEFDVPVRVLLKGVNEVMVRLIRGQAGPPQDLVLTEVRLSIDYD